MGVEVVNAFEWLAREARRIEISDVLVAPVEQIDQVECQAEPLPIGERLRSTLALRYDVFWAKVNARSLPINGGSSRDGKLSLKANFAYRISAPLELYASYGEGFHSNDARGTTIRRDPVTGDAAQRVNALVGSRGAELGVRWFPAGKINASLGRTDLLTHFDRLHSRSAMSLYLGTPSGICPAGIRRKSITSFITK